MPTERPPLSWDHVYLLVWHGRDKRAFMTTWDGDAPMVHVVVTGLDESYVYSNGCPLWRAPVPPQAGLVEVPEGEDPHQYAEAQGGYYAYGWHLSEVIDRVTPMRDPIFG